MQEKSISRRRFLTKTAEVTAAGLLVCSPLSVLAATERRSLSFYHTHTREHLEVEYAIDRLYDHKAMNKVNRFMRDHRTGEVFPIDPRVLDILFEAQCICGQKGVFEVISGFRSPQTNAMLRGKSSGVARRSLHMDGMALDVRLCGYDTAKLRDIAIGLRRGGVGYYEKSNFIHVDTGRVRAW